MLKKLILTLVLLAALPLVAQAAARVSSIGPRFGFSVDPDQLVVGGQLGIGPIAKDLTFDPNLELGFGDDVTVVALNMDMHYHLRVSDSDWRPYAGFGVGINFISWDRPAPHMDGSDTEVGGNFIFGMEVPAGADSKFFGELKLGLGDIPTLKILAGWNYPFGR